MNFQIPGFARIPSNVETPFAQNQVSGGNPASTWVHLAPRRGLLHSFQPVRSGFRPVGQPATTSHRCHGQNSLGPGLPGSCTRRYIIGMAIHKVRILNDHYRLLLLRETWPYTIETEFRPWAHTGFGHFVLGFRGPPTTLEDWFPRRLYNKQNNFRGGSLLNFTAT